MLSQSLVFLACCALGVFSPEPSAAKGAVARANRIARAFLGTAVVATVVLASWYAPRVLPKVLARERRENPEQVVESFYEWYLTTDEPYQSSGYLTQGLVAKVGEMIASLEGGGADPLLCAQDVPGDLSIEPATVSRESANVPVTIIWNRDTEFESYSYVSVDLERLGGRWLIAQVWCLHGDPLAPVNDPHTQPTTIEGWQHFDDEAHGYHIQYPTDWTYDDAEIETPGESPIVRVVVFRHKGEGQPIAPVSIEVGRGNWKELRGHWPLAIKEPAETRIINSHVAIVGRGVGDELFYVFHHPSDPGLWVTIRDSLGEDDPAVVGVAEQMLSTFGFGK